MSKQHLLLLWILGLALVINSLLAVISAEYLSVVVSVLVGVSIFLSYRSDPQRRSQSLHLTLYVVTIATLVLVVIRIVEYL